MLFFVKIVRATNDNFAVVFYNAVGLRAYFWTGFVVCLFSVFCSFILV
jgi:nitrate/nitrite transporter NarK